MSRSTRLNGRVGAADVSGAYSQVISLGAANGTDDTTAIQNKLTLAAATPGSIVRGVPGQFYKISSRLVISSGTRLEMTGCTITENASSNSQMITNYSYANPAATASDAAVSSASNVITTSLGAQAVVGQSVKVVGAGANGQGELIGVVSASTSTTITITKLDGTAAANASATVSGAVITLYNRDTDIAIVGGKWDRGANGPNTGVARASALAGHSIFLQSVDRFTVDIERALSTAGITFVWVTNVRDGWVAVRDANVVRTILQVVGPIHRMRIERIAGYSSDDMVNVCGNVYKEQTDTAGDVSAVTVGQIVGKGTPGNGSGLKINAGTGCNIADVAVGTLSGLLHLGVNIGEDPLRPETTAGTYGTIDCGRIVAAIAGAPLTMVNPQADRIEAYIRRDATNGTVSYSIPSGGTASQTTGELVITMDAFLTATRAFEIFSGNIEHLIMRNCRAVGDDCQLLYLSGGAVDTITFENCRGNWLNKHGLLMNQQGGTVGKVHVIGGSGSAGAAILRGISSLTSNWKISNFTGVGMDRMCNNPGAAQIYLDNVSYDGSNALILANTGAVDLYGTIRLTGTGALLGRAGSEVVHAHGLGLPLDLSILTPANGDLAYNTNAGLACGVGPAVSNGTLWKNLYTGTTYP